jgi:hypothetical protein
MKLKAAGAGALMGAGAPMGADCVPLDSATNGTLMRR